MAGAFAYLGNVTVGAAVARGLEAEGWERVDDAASADAVVTYFTNSHEHEDAYFDTEGLVKSAYEGALLVDLSPSTPSFAREISAVATVNELRYVEAPLVVRYPSEADAFAKENLQCFLASDDEGVFDEVEQMLFTFVSAVERVGAFGMAQLARCACTAQIASQVMGAVESSVLYDAAGSSVASAIVPACSPVAGRMLAAIDADAFEGDYTIEMLMGDVVSAMTTADEEGLILPQLEATMHMLEVLAVIGGADMAPAALALLFRDEQASADAGLDWTRAEGLFVDGDHEHHHHHDHDADAADYDDYDYDDYDEDDPFGFAGGFGGYSAN